MEKFNLIIVEDDHELASLTQAFFQQFEFNCKVISEGQRAVEQIIAEQPDLVLLDLMLPDIDGMQVFQQIKPSYSGKVAMLTARGDTIDQVLGLEFGADDYISKPFSPIELVSRVKALLRRSRPGLFEDNIEHGEIKISLSQRLVTRNGIAVNLGPKEFKILSLFMERPGHIYSRSKLLDFVWGQGVFIEDRTVDVHMSRLRKALKTKPSDKDLIRTVRDGGYGLLKN